MTRVFGQVSFNPVNKIAVGTTIADCPPHGPGVSHHLHHPEGLP
jgi:hypothetical protein